MEVVLFLIPWTLLGIAILFISFTGGPGKAREAYLTGGRRAFAAIIPILYIGLGIAVPVLVISDRGEAQGGTERTREEPISHDLEEGKQLFREACASCHTLAAVQARGVTGPNLDEIGEVTVERVENAIRNGGASGERMPADLVRDEDAKHVAEYVAAVAGK